MNTKITALLLLITTSAIAQQIHVQAKELCQNANISRFFLLKEQNLHIKEAFFTYGLKDEICPIWQNQALERSLNVVTIKPKKQSRWSLHVHFGPFINFFSPNNIRLVDNEGTDLVLKRVKPTQRTSFDFYRIWDTSDGQNPLQFIDEPQNRIGVEVRNKKVIVGLEYLHPKIIFHNIDNRQFIDIEGTLKGEKIDETNADLSEYFHNITSTLGNANLELYLLRAFNIFPRALNHRIQLHLGAGAGVTFAQGNISVSNKVDGDDESKNQITPVGTSMSIRSRIEYKFPKDRFHLSLGYDLGLTNINGQVDEFETQTSLMSQRISATLGVRIFKSKKRRSQKERLYDF